MLALDQNLCDLRLSGSRASRSVFIVLVKCYGVKRGGGGAEGIDLSIND